MGWFPSELADPCQLLGLTRLEAEGLSAFASPRLDVYLQEGLPPCNLNESLLLVDEGLERLDAIENTLEVHPAVAPDETRSKQPHLLPKSAAGCSSLSWPARRAVLPGGGTPPHAGSCRSSGEPPQAEGGWLTALQSPARDAAHIHRRVGIARLVSCLCNLSAQSPVKTAVCTHRFC